MCLYTELRLRDSREISAPGRYMVCEARMPIRGMTEIYIEIDPRYDPTMFKRLRVKYILNVKSRRRDAVLSDKPWLYWDRVRP